MPTEAEKILSWGARRVSGSYRVGVLGDRVEGRPLGPGGAASLYVVVVPREEEHFFIDYLGCLVPRHPWPGRPGGDYWAAPDLPEVAPRDFRSVVFFASGASLPPSGNGLAWVLLHAHAWRPVYMVGVDLRKGRVVSRVALQEKKGVACSALRVPLL